jgi:hypothetical protein
VWPELKAQLPEWLKLPKTLHERVHELAQASRTQEQINETYGAIHYHLAGRIERLEEDRTKAIEERSKLSLRITSIDQTLQEIPNHVKRQVELTELIQGMRDCLNAYADIRSLYPDSPLATKPFATGWRPSRPDQDVDKETREADHWANRLEGVIERERNFISKWSIPVFNQELNDLLTWVGTWKVNRHDTSATQLAKAMALNYNGLLTQRDSYAATLAAAAGNAKATTS